MSISRLSKTKKILGPLAVALIIFGIVSFFSLGIIYRGNPSIGLRLILPLWVVMFCVSLGLVLVEYSSTLGYIIRMELSREKAGNYHGPFFVLLRSFKNRDMYQRRPASNPHFPIETNIPITSKFPTIDNISAKLEISLRSKGMLVALGGKFELSPDSEMLVLNSNEVLWREDIRLLAAHSKGILLLPETTKGVLEEMKVLLEKGLTEKTIVIMPPLYGFDFFETGQEAARWDTLRKELSEHGFYLPQATASGMAFIPKADLSIKRATSLRVKKVNPLFRGEDDYGLPEAMDQLISHLKGQWTPLKDVCPLLRSPIRPGIYRVRDVLAEADESIMVALAVFVMLCIVTMIGIFAEVFG